MTKRSEMDDLRKQNPELTGLVATGVEALRAGQRVAARQLLGRAVRGDPGNATAWFWLSRTLDDELQRRECLARVRALDRANAVQPVPAPAPKDRPRLGLGRTHGSRWGGIARLLRRPRAFGLAALFVLLACAAMLLAGGQSARARSVVDAAEGTLEASGLIRAEQIMIASEHGGYIDAILFQEGEAVEAGQTLVQLDTALLDAQIEAARAAVALAKAGLAVVKAGARPGQIAVAKAQRLQAEAARLAATQAVSDTLLLVQNPQDIQLQISVLQAQARAAEHKLSGALALKDGAEIGKDRFYEAQSAIRDAGGPGKRRFRAKAAEGSLAQIVERVPKEIRDRLLQIPGDGVYTFGDVEIEVHGPVYTLYRWVTVDLYLPFEAHLAPNAWWQAWVGVNAAAAEKEGLEASLNLLYNQRAHPQDLQARADQAVAALAQAEAQVAAAQAQVDGKSAGATREQVAVLEAKVAQAETALDSLLTQRAQTEVVAPSDGTVLVLSAHRGEVAAKGATLVMLADLDTVKLVVYLPETSIGQIDLGQAVQVTVDSFPGRVFQGTVAHIADSAEFTPRHVATVEERANLVFAVEIGLPNEDGALKPGMPADAVFER